MVAVITGDIANSQQHAPTVWLTPLKEELNRVGKSPRNWEIYRGDSFQLLIPDAADALLTAIRIKAALRSLPGQSVDVRMAIGLGEKTYDAERITESNGSAFVHSGEKFEMLKQEKQHIAVKSDHPEFDKEMNLYLKLALIAMDNWTTNAAEIVKTAIENPGKSQEELGQLLNIKQNAVSGRLKRAYYGEIKEVIEMYQTRIKALK